MFIPATTDYGKHLDLGVTFDAHSNQPRINIFSRDVQKDVKRIDRMTFEYKLIKNSKEARDFLDVSGELSLKIKSGIVGVEGKGSYLKETNTDEGTVELLAKMTCETVMESIRHEDHSPNVKYNTDQQAKELGTHFAQSVIYGAEMVTSIKIKNASDSKREDIHGEFKGDLTVKMVSGGLKAELDKMKKRISESSSTEIRYFANDMPKSLPTTLDELIPMIASFPSRIPNQGKGVPMSYAMHPLSELHINKAPTYRQNPALQIIIDSLEKEFDDLQAAQAVMDDFYNSKASQKEASIKELQKFSKQLTKLTNMYKKVIMKLDLDEKGPGEGQFEDAREEYENALEDGDSARWKFKRYAETLIDKYCPVFREGMYSVINEEEWRKLRLRNFTMAQIKLHDQELKTEIDKRMQSFVLSKNMSGGKNKNGNKEIRIVLVGKTGNGKSATGNTILKKDEFRVSGSEESVTQVIKECEAMIGGRRVRIIDTPGLFDTKRDQNAVLYEVAKVLNIFQNGVHIFALVMNGTQRYTKEEQTVLRDLKRMFGDQLLKHCVVLLTHGDLAFSSNSLETYVQNLPAGAMHELLVQDVSKHVMAFNNKYSSEYERNLQSKNFLELVDTVLAEAGGGVYTDDLFKEAQKIRKELEEKEEQERKAKVDRELKAYHEAIQKCKQLANAEAKHYFQSKSLENIKQDSGYKNAIAAVTSQVKSKLTKEELYSVTVKVDGDKTPLELNIEAEVTKEAQLATSSKELKEALEKMFRFTGQVIDSNLTILDRLTEDELVEKVKDKLTPEEIKLIGEDKIRQSVERERNSADTNNRVNDKINELTTDLQKVFSDIAQEYINSNTKIKEADVKENSEAMKTLRTKVKAKMTDEMKLRFSDSELMKEIVKYVKTRSDLIEKIKESGGGACFPAHSKVETRNRGEVMMSELEVGDLVPVMTARGIVSYEEVYLFSHGDPNAKSEFVVIATESGHTLTLSPGHLLPIGESKELREAGQVKVGDLVYICQGDSFLSTRVANLHMEHTLGLYCPHTASGTILVDGVLASCYTNAIDPSLAGLMLLPARFLYAVLPRPWYDHLAAYNPQSGMPKVVHKYRHYFI